MPRARGCRRGLAWRWLGRLRGRGVGWLGRRGCSAGDCRGRSGGRSGGKRDRDLLGCRRIAQPRVRAALVGEQQSKLGRIFDPIADKLLVASTAGDGFVVPSDEVLAQTRAGKQVLTVKDGVKTALCRRVTGDSVAVVGDNRKVLVFALAELPEMAKGKGVRLQKYKDGGLVDATTFTLADGLTWKDPAGRTRTEMVLDEWLAKRAAAGRMPPRLP